VSLREEGTKTEGVQKQGAEEDTWKQSIP